MNVHEMVSVHELTWRFMNTNPHFKIVKLTVVLGSKSVMQSSNSAIIPHVFFVLIFIETVRFDVTVIKFSNINAQFVTVI